jgi:hypothetical protein
LVQAALQKQPAEMEMLAMIQHLARLPLLLAVMAVGM